MRMKDSKKAVGDVEKTLGLTWFTGLRGSQVGAVEEWID